MKKEEALRSLINHDATGIRHYENDYNCVITKFSEFSPNKIVIIQPSEEFLDNLNGANAFDFKNINRITKKTYGLEDVILWEKA